MIRMYNPYSHTGLHGQMGLKLGLMLCCHQAEIYSFIFLVVLKIKPRSLNMLGEAMSYTHSVQAETYKIHLWTCVQLNEVQWKMEHMYEQRRYVQHPCGHSFLFHLHIALVRPCECRLLVNLPCGFSKTWSMLCLWLRGGATPRSHTLLSTWTRTCFEHRKTTVISTENCMVFFLIHVAYPPLYSKWWWMV